MLTVTEQDITGKFQIGAYTVHLHLPLPQPGSGRVVRTTWQPHPPGDDLSPAENDALSAAFQELKAAAGCGFGIEPEPEPEPWMKALARHVNPMIDHEMTAAQEKLLNDDVVDGGYLRYLLGLDDLDLDEYDDLTDPLVAKEKVLRALRHLLAVRRLSAGEAHDADFLRQALVWAVEILGEERDRLSHDYTTRDRKLVDLTTVLKDATAALTESAKLAPG